MRSTGISVHEVVTAIREQVEGSLIFLLPARIEALWSADCRSADKLQAVVWSLSVGGLFGPGVLKYLIPKAYVSSTIELVGGSDSRFDTDPDLFEVGLAVSDEASVAVQLFFRGDVCLVGRAHPVTIDEGDPGFSRDLKEE